MKKFAGDDREVESGFIECDDTTFWVTCECGCRIEQVVSDSEITRCPNCGKGYRGEFVVWQYDTGEE